MMRRWLILGFVTVVLMLCSGYAERFTAYVNWQLEGIAAMDDAEDALERCGVAGKVVEIAPSLSRMAVAGHVKTDTGTQGFFVQFALGNEGRRVPVKVTLGMKTLLPPPAE